jgi:prepilin-type N-terminal cleavage/methylation domain-containing protein
MKSVFKCLAGAAGFSITELMVVTAIGGLIMGIAAPSFMRWLPNIRLSSAAREVATDLQMARMKAITQNTTYTVAFNNNAYTFGTNTRDVSSLYPGITVTASANPVFSARGTANAGVTITLSNGSTQKLVCVKTVGRVNIATSC